MESNKLIAEFMGIESYKSKKYTMFVYEENNHRTDVDLHYHTSWDWLMPVVEKIESCNASVTINGVYSEFTKKVGHQVTIRIESVEMNEGGKSAWVLEDKYKHHSNVRDNRIDAVYESVIHFIKNQNN
tara:strand:+ start:8066 stop:8449 length:384 start_codon:yes stop_codon:yes gene_type:complete